MRGGVDGDLGTIKREPRMLTGIFVILVVTALVLHHVFTARSPERRTGLEAPPPLPITLREAVGNLPEAVLLQPTFTWTRLRKNGEIFLGLHPILTGLLGVDYTLELLADDATVRKGSRILRLRQGDRELELFSPVNGEVTEANTGFSPLSGWEGHTMRGGSWIYRIQPEGLEAELPLWLRTDEASAWAHRQYRTIRDFLFQAERNHEVGLAAADGGELPAGVLSQMDDLVWSSFQEVFLPPPGQPEAE